jgi:hypothetical protein
MMSLPTKPSLQDSQTEWIPIDPVRTGAILGPVGMPPNRSRSAIPPGPSQAHKVSLGAPGEVSPGAFELAGQRMMFGQGSTPIWEVSLLFGTSGFPGTSTSPLLSRGGR